ncbi:hypothetical protein GCM10020216_070650 [Nonomuraea helvata]
MSQPPEIEIPGLRWEPYQRPPRDRIRITETSCCGAYEWACQGGQFLILRSQEPGRYEEAARGLYRQARQIWQALLVLHEEEHRREMQASAAAEAKRRKRKLRRGQAVA